MVCRPPLFDCVVETLDAGRSCVVGDDIKLTVLGTAVDGPVLVVNVNGYCAVVLGIDNEVEGVS